MKLVRFPQVMSPNSTRQQEASCFGLQNALKKLPLNDPLLPHAEFVDFRQRQNSHVDDVIYFVQRYKHLLPFEDPMGTEQDFG
ncbi:hypothetical protein OYC64_008083 [Pagothenia borchgrevinki]|uniref:Uncharacterized protein n=1 Tax=Pagothenia borchgrevinki TaxID=8213 RepID=A0ABD2GUN6_PAGBO